MDDLKAPQISGYICNKPKKIQRMEIGAKEYFEKTCREQQRNENAGDLFQKDSVKEIFLDLPYNEYTHIPHPENFYVDKVLEYGRN